MQYLEENKKRIIFSFIFSLAPLLLSFFIFSFYFDPSYFQPYYSDEVHYWNEIRNFYHAGFRSGYTVINEQKSLVPFFTFGPHGPFFPMIGAFMMLLWGEHYTLPLFFNALFSFLSLFTFNFIVLKNNFLKMFIFSFFLLSFWPFYNFMFSLMQESLNYSISILISVAIFYLREKRKIPFWIFSFVSTMLRASWGVICFALLFLKDKKVILIFLFSLLWMKFILPPYSRITPFNKLIAFILGPSFASWNDFFFIFLNNIKKYFFLYKGSEIIPFFFRIELLIVFFYALLFDKKNFFRRESLMILSLSLGMLLFLYEVGGWRDLRFLAPSLVLSLALLIAGGKKNAFFLFIVAAQFLSAFYFLPFSHQIKKNNFLKESDHLLEIRKKIVFDPLKERWCNTLLINTPDEELMGEIMKNVPSGIGVSVLHLIDNVEVSLPFKSGYLFLNSWSIGELHKRGYYPRLKKIESFASGVFYENRDSSCFRKK